MKKTWPFLTSFVAIASLALLACFTAAQTARSQCTTPPVITFQPSDEAQFEGQPVTFTVGVSSPPECGPVIYEWYELVGVDGNLDPIPGGTNASVTIIATSYPNDPDHNRFGCRIENAAGVAWIDYVTLTVLDPDCTSAPTVTQQPQDKTAKVGTSVTFTVGATSPPGCAFTYQWFEYVGVDGQADYIPGATGPSVTVIATHHQTDPDRNRFGCELRSDGGLTTTHLAVLTVLGGTYQGEWCPVENSSGDTVRTVSDTSASAGNTLMIDSNATGDYVTLRLERVPPATYSVRVRYKKHPSRGKVQAMIGKIGGSLSNIGGVIDLYSSNPGYQEYTLGNWTPTSYSDKQIRFKITGKNSSSSGYTMNIDYVKLVPQ